MLVVWKGLFEDNYSHVRGDSPDQKNFGPFGNLQLPSPPAEREGGCKFTLCHHRNSKFSSHGLYGFHSNLLYFAAVASFRATSIAGSSTNPGTLSAGFRADSALSEIASSVSMNVSTISFVFNQPQYHLWFLCSPGIFKPSDHGGISLGSANKYLDNAYGFVLKTGPTGSGRPIG